MHGAVNDKGQKNIFGLVYKMPSKMELPEEITFLKKQLNIGHNECYALKLSVDKVQYNGHIITNCKLCALLGGKRNV